MGHTECGAVQSAIPDKTAMGSGSPHLDHLIDTVRNNIPDDVRKAPGTAFETAVKANASAVLNSILNNSPLVQSAVSSGSLVIMQAIYDIHDGTVKYLGALENLAL